MAKDPAFLFYPGDYLRDTQCLSANAQAAYDRIMCEHMRNISLDMSKIVVSQKGIDFFIKKLSEEERAEVYHVLDKIEGGFQIHWVALSISKRKGYTNSRAENRSNKNKKDTPSDMKTYELHMENEDEIVINSTNTAILKTEKMIVTEMMKVWNKHNPKSLIDIEKDYSACLEIAHKIAQVKGWKKTDVINLKELDVVQSWERIMIFIKSDNFLKKLPLANLNNNFQMVVQNMVAANEENNTSLRVQKVQPMTEKEKQKAMEEWANSD